MMNINKILIKLMKFQNNFSLLGRFLLYQKVKMRIKKLCARSNIKIINKLAKIKKILIFKLIIII